MNLFDTASYCGIFHMVNPSVHILHLFMWTIVIGSQILFINFSILDIICGSIRIVHLSSVPVHVQIRMCTGVFTFPYTILQYKSTQIISYKLQLGVLKLQSSICKVFDLV
jgi:hypothetical protein